ncbi:MAG: SpoIIIAH-like family protein [Oscillospiraceae bacterium]|nr:SpoIIIAH-like family protein [Oscillospiraceae bacterium]
MRTWKRNAIVTALLLFVCGGIYLNWLYEDGRPFDLVSTLDQTKLMDDAALVIRKDEPELEQTSAQSAEQQEGEDAEAVFARMRMSRQQSRDSAVHTLQETISYAGEDEDVSASTLKLESIVNMALSEASIESLVVSKGYEECVAYMTEEGIDLAVASKGLSETDVAVLSDIVLSQTNYDLSQIRIIEVKS